MNRFALPLFAVLVLGSAAQADRLVNIPTGKRINFKEGRFEVLSVPSRDFAFGTFRYGIGESWEIEAMAESLNQDTIDFGFSLTYNYISPFTDASPGISFGISDIGDNLTERRTAWAAITYAFGNDGALNQNVPTELTLGLWTRDEGFFFAGAALPYSEHLWVIGEHDSRRITAGFELRPFPEASLRFLWRGGDPMIGMSYSARF